jgi:hypothetical protein
MFLFAFVDGVEPTNNAAERALRHGMLWPASTASFVRSVMCFPECFAADSSAGVTGVGRPRINQALMSSTAKNKANPKKNALSTQGDDRAELVGKVSIACLEALPHADGAA